MCCACCAVLCAVTAAADDRSPLQIFTFTPNKNTHKKTHSYSGVDIWVTENGVPPPGEDSLPLPAALLDPFRVDYYRGYLGALCQAVSDGAPVKAFMAWSFAGE